MLEVVNKINKFATSFWLFTDLKTGLKPKYFALFSGEKRTFPH